MELSKNRGPITLAYIILVKIPIREHPSTVLDLTNSFRISSSSSFSPPPPQSSVNLSVKDSFFHHVVTRGTRLVRTVGEGNASLDDEPENRRTAGQNKPVLLCGRGQSFPNDLSVKTLIKNSLNSLVARIY